MTDEHEQLLDQWWGRLGVTATEGHGLLRTITRDQLAEAMRDAALSEQPIDRGGGGSLGPVGALVQSLTVMGREARDSRPGWSIVAHDALAFIARVTKDVTRFLEYPGLHVRHPTVNDDLSVVAVRFQADGTCLCTLRVPGTDIGEQGQWVFGLGELNVSGPVDDMVRAMVAGMARAFVDDAVTRMRESGQLQDERDHNGGMTLAESAAAGEEPATVIDNGDGTYRMSDGSGGAGTYPRQGVDHLQAHPEYVMEPGGAHAEVATALARDKVQEVRDLCPQCHLPMHNCICVPMHD